jgi:hypothetical protein
MSFPNELRFWAASGDFLYCDPLPAGINVV